jgi:RNA-directed DNA polymerase
MDIKKDISIHTIERFLNLKDSYELSVLLQKKLSVIRHHCYYPEYSAFFLIKKSGGIREIEAPVESLKRIQKLINAYLNRVYNKSIPDSVHGFISKKGIPESRSIVSNARNHTHKKVILSIDLKDFFHSITDLEILELFKSKPFHFNEEVAFVLTKLTTFKGRLPMGAPTSPVLSNLYCLKIDHELEDLCHKENVTYSRYADDLTFSSDKPICQELINSIKSILDTAGFCLNTNKFRFQQANFKQVVNGIKVNKKVNVDRKYIRRLRAILHNLESKGVLHVVMEFYQVSDKPTSTQGRKFFYSLEGQINHVGYVRGFEDLVYLKLKNKYDLFKEKVGMP